jgi:hypothetical protein
VIKLESSRSTTETIDSIAPVTEVGAELDNTGFSELKGAKWPGMGQFDSATDEQKRKRNQKKDRSVLQSMVISSESVTPTEHVWDDYFNELKRTRNIYDSPSIEGTPVSLAAGILSTDIISGSSLTDIATGSQRSSRRDRESRQEEKKSPSGWVASSMHNSSRLFHDVVNCKGSPL